MTVSTAEKLSGPVIEKKDEKVEKRRALGRGLESLLPGPRAAHTDRGGAAPHELKPESSSAGVGAVKAVPFPVVDPLREQGGASPTEPTAAVPPQSHEVISIQTPANSANLVVNLDLDLIEKNPYQTRYVFDEEALSDLRDSIREHGVVQPVVVRPAEQEGRYILVLGERRLRASKMAGKETIPALMRRLSLQQAAEMTVLENVVREDLTCMEQAEAFRVLSREFHLTQQQIAERIGVSRETVANYMRLLRLPEKVRNYLLEDRLSFSDAREILRLENEEHIELVAEEVVNKRLKWDEIEERVMRLNGTFPTMPGAPPKEQRAARWMDPNVRAAQTDMERTLGMRVRIKDRQGKGKIVIEYATVDDYERLVEMLRGRKSSS